MLATRETMTPREREEFEQDKLVTEMQSAHALRLKELDIELAKLESKWAALLRLPMAVIMLPVRILFGFAYICAVFMKYEPPEQFWLFLGVKKPE